MKTHTPGPWKADRMFLGASKDRRSGFVVNGPDAEPLPIRICDLRCSPESPFAVSEANARLIAAAPDLLEVCRIFARANHLESCRNQMLPAMLELIAKVEGTK